MFNWFINCLLSLYYPSSAVSDVLDFETSYNKNFATAALISNEALLTIYMNYPNHLQGLTTS